ncbi:NFACT RNA binding domain-containing protein [Anditalea andensis]|uniref:RNA-binding protein n=1 Tax=Anditalea andensis TaxID=1048983 RepID=A0A074KVS5_9BACT|nr:NFACT RNA binding domain-containing protein [Anditalea andensis]KEO72365.1 RNA-binding protein [Anditalea andensis]
MHLNYHFFKFLCPELDNEYRGFELLEAFSQNKNELILAFERDGKEKYIRANLLPANTVIDYPQTFARSLKNNVNLFNQLVGEIVSAVCPFLNERAFYIRFQSGLRLVFKMHGSRSNILLYTDNETTPVLLFRNELKDDFELNFKHFDRSLDLSYEKFITLEGNVSQFLPTLGKVPRDWLKERGYLSAGLQRRWELIIELLDMLDSPIYSIVKESNAYHLTLLPVEESIFQSSSPIAASNAFFKHAVIYSAFEKEKGVLLKAMQEQMRKTEAYINKTSEKLKSMEMDTSPHQLADIIMANLHQIHLQSEEITLYDFYQNREVTFKIKRGTSPQKHAENLYRKGKNRRIELEQLNKNLQDKQNLILALGKHVEELNGIQDFRTLRAYQKHHTLTPNSKSQMEQVPFKRFEIEGFTILVGKSAKSNDEMLRKYTYKEDLWLHAKNVPGSHVIIKAQANRKLPKTVLEKAAELAAYYSKYRTDGLAPVIYTPAKYVRKVKGSAPGAVMVDKESVIMVRPNGPKDD